MNTTRDRGTELSDRGAWADAYALLSATVRDEAAPEELERLANAAYLTGREAESEAAWARAHRQWLRAGNASRASRCAFWLAFGLLLRGEEARASGWIARAQRMLDDADLQRCAERGFLLVPVALVTLERDPVAAYAAFTQAGEIGKLFDEPDLITLGRLGCGQALIRAGKTAEGIALLDEVMIAITADDVSARVAGLVYCAVLLECQNTFDLRRARQWTAALTHWCDEQPDLVPYRGQCLVHRAELMQLSGDWPDAIDEARLACRRLADAPAAAMAHYQLAELHRLRGEYAAAEAAYREASRRGRSPQPGLALLRLAQGQVDVAAAAMRAVMDEAPDRLARSHLLSAHVEIMLAAGDVRAGRAAADELAEIAANLCSGYVGAVAAQAAGAVHLAGGEARAALSALRRAWTAWHELQAPYEAARTRVLIALAYRDLGDLDGAASELDAAGWAFRQLGAVADLCRTERIAVRAGANAVSRLTARETQVLRLIAAGKTNRAIAADLFLSEKTVARHVSNILAKLELGSRSAATAYAYEHDLV